MSRTQRLALDTRLRAITPVFGPADSSDQARDGIDGARAAFAALMATMPVPTGFTTRETELGGRRTLRFDPVPEQRAAGAILYFHGGSFVSGSPETHLGLTGELVTRTRLTAFSVDYRLTPEHPFPAAVDDTTAAYRTLLEQGHAADSIVFAGDSAGGGLTVTTLLRAREQGLPMPAALVAFSPGLDNVGTGASNVTRRDADPLLDPAMLRPSRELYRGNADPDQPLLSPASSADLTGFPPMLLQVGTHEILLDDSTRLARRAWEADVDVVLDVTAGVPHVFQTHTDSIDEAGQALDRAALFITQHLA